MPRRGLYYSRKHPRSGFTLSVIESLLLFLSLAQSCGALCRVDEYAKPTSQRRYPTFSNLQEALNKCPCSNSIYAPVSLVLPPQTTILLQEPDKSLCFINIYYATTNNSNCEVSYTNLTFARPHSVVHVFSNHPETTLCAHFSSIDPSSSLSLDNLKRECAPDDNLATPIKSLGTAIIVSGLVLRCVENSPWLISSATDTSLIFNNVTLLDCQEMVHYSPTRISLNKQVSVWRTTITSDTFSIKVSGVQSFDFSENRVTGQLEIDVEFLPQLYGHCTVLRNDFSQVNARFEYLPGEYQHSWNSTHSNTRVILSHPCQEFFRGFSGPDISYTVLDSLLEEYSQTSSVYDVELVFGPQEQTYRRPNQLLQSFPTDYYPEVCICTDDPQWNNTPTNPVYFVRGSFEFEDVLQYAIDQCPHDVIVVDLHSKPGGDYSTVDPFVVRVDGRLALSIIATHSSAFDYLPVGFECIVSGSMMFTLENLFILDAQASPLGTVHFKGNGVVDFELRRCTIKSERIASFNATPGSLSLLKTLNVTGSRLIGGGFRLTPRNIVSEGATIRISDNQWLPTSGRIPLYLVYPGSTLVVVSRNTFWCTGSTKLTEVVHLETLDTNCTGFTTISGNQWCSLDSQRVPQTLPLVSRNLCGETLVTITGNWVDTTFDIAWEISPQTSTLINDNPGSILPMGGFIDGAARTEPIMFSDLLIPECQVDENLNCAPGRLCFRDVSQAIEHCSAVSWINFESDRSRLLVVRRQSALRLLRIYLDVAHTLLFTEPLEFDHGIDINVVGGILLFGEGIPLGLMDHNHPTSVQLQSTVLVATSDSRKASNYKWLIPTSYTDNQINILDCAIIKLPRSVENNTASWILSSTEGCQNLTAAITRDSSAYSIDFSGCYDLLSSHSHTLGSVSSTNNPNECTIISMQQTVVYHWPGGILKTFDTNVEIINCSFVASGGLCPLDNALFEVRGNPAITYDENYESDPPLRITIRDCNFTHSLGLCSPDLVTAISNSDDSIICYRNLSQQYGITMVKDPISAVWIYSLDHQSVSLSGLRIQEGLYPLAVRVSDVSQWDSIDSHPYCMIDSSDYSPFLPNSTLSALQTISWANPEARGVIHDFEYDGILRFRHPLVYCDGFDCSETPPPVCYCYPPQESGNKCYFRAHPWYGSYLFDSIASALRDCAAQSGVIMLTGNRGLGGVEFNETLTAVAPNRTVISDNADNPARVRGCGHRIFASNVTFTSVVFVLDTTQECGLSIFWDDRKQPLFRQLTFNLCQFDGRFSKNPAVYLQNLDVLIFNQCEWYSFGYSSKYPVVAIESAHSVNFAGGSFSDIHPGRVLINSTRIGSLSISGLYGSYSAQPQIHTDVPAVPMIVANSLDRYSNLNLSENILSCSYGMLSASNAANYTGFLVRGIGISSLCNSTSAIISGNRICGAWIGVQIEDLLGAVNESLLNASSECILDDNPGITEYRLCATQINGQCQNSTLVEPLAVVSVIDVQPAKLTLSSICVFDCSLSTYIIFGVGFLVLLSCSVCTVVLLCSGCFWGDYVMSYSWSYLFGIPMFFTRGRRLETPKELPRNNYRAGTGRFSQFERAREY